MKVKSKPMEHEENITETINNLAESINQLNMEIQAQQSVLKSLISTLEHYYSTDFVDFDSDGSQIIVKAIDKVLDMHIFRDAVLFNSIDCSIDDLYEWREYDAAEA